MCRRQQPRRSKKTTFRSVADLLAGGGLIEGEAESGGDIGDLTREPLSFPAGRDLRLQNLARGDEGFLLALAYSTQRGFGRNHPFAGENPLRRSRGRILCRGCRFHGSARHDCADRMPDGQSVRRQHGPSAALYPVATALPLARASANAWQWRWSTAPCVPRNSARKQALQRKTRSSCSAIPTMCRPPASSEHLKLPHYVDFQAELGLLRKLQAEFFARDAQSDAPMQDAAE